MLLYNQITSLDEETIKKALQNYFIEDMPENDCTTELMVDEKHTSTALFNSREPIIFCGADIIKFAFSDSMKIETISDGTKVNSGDKIASVSGPTKEILIKERVILNLIQRLSGIATSTHQYVEALDSKNIKILDTRKTTPGLRDLEKFAVYIGGGSSHRKNLSTGILIKDNHLSVTSIEKTIKKIKQTKQMVPIQIEVDFIDQITSELVQVVDGFLLDNMSPTQMRECIVKINNLNISNRKMFIEASGGVTLDKISDYNIEGLHGISIGALTHHIRSVDIGLDY